MSTKALKTQLLAAIAMVLVASIALGSSTYAWFAANNAVQATTQKVAAVSTDPFLYIAAGSGVDAATGSWATSASDASADAAVKAVTSADGVKFAQLASTVSVSDKGSSAATWTGTGGAFADGDLVDATGTYKIANTFSVINKDTTTATDLYVKSVKITVTDTDGKDMSKAARVAITMGTKTLVFNPNNGTNNDSKVGKYDTKWTLVTDTGIYMTANTTAASLGSLSGNTSTDVVITIWFEGQDTQLYTNNMDVDKLQAVVEFTTVAPV